MSALSTPESRTEFNAAATIADNSDDATATDPIDNKSQFRGRGIVCPAPELCRLSHAERKLQRRRFDLRREDAILDARWLYWAVRDVIASFCGSPEPELTTSEIDDEAVNNIYGLW